jgi:hypothetical protein
MTTVEGTNTMKLSKQTFAILKSMAGINSNIHVLPGNELVCVNAGKSIMFNAKVEENFPTEFAIWDLSQFLGTYSLFNDPTVDFGNTSLRIESGRQSCEYNYADPRLVEGCRPPSKLNLPEIKVTFDLSQQEINDILRASAVMQLPDIMFTNEESKVKVVVFDKEKANSTNKYEIVVTPSDMESSASFKIYMKADLLKILPGDYEFNLCEKLAILLKHKDIDANYTLAVTNDSVYNGMF